MFVEALKLLGLKQFADSYYTHISLAMLHLLGMFLSFYSVVLTTQRTDWCNRQDGFLAVKVLLQKLPKFCRTRPELTAEQEAQQLWLR